MEPSKGPPSGGESDIHVNLGEEAVAAAAAPRGRRRRGHQQHEEENLERWLLTYCDLITLLMAIFVIMYASSRVKEGARGISVEIQHIQNVTAKEKRFLPVIPDAEVRKIERLRIQIESLRKIKRLGPFIHLTKSSKGVTVSFEGTLLFNSGEATLKEEAKRAIDILVPNFKSVPNNLRVEGHTDDVPIHTEAYPSNWHLSTARAISIVEYLVNKHRMSQDRFSALGYADLKPIVPNTSDRNRARNRRVDVTILYESGH